MQDQARSDVALLYRRAGFGLRPEDLDLAAAGGYETAVEELVAGLGAPDPSGDAVGAPTFTAAPSTVGGDLASRQARNRAVAEDLTALRGWWTHRMMVTQTPLREKLVLFWSNHFATAATKVRDAHLMYVQNELFRRAGAGPFEDLAQAVAKDGAMMIWLDASSDKKAHPNENFAREMMELFTLGVGNYTQADVTSAARGFTGWTYDRRDYRYVYRPYQHDAGVKTYLGRTGAWNGEDIVHIAVSRPESARFVLSRLWSHFAYPVAPSDRVVSDLLPAFGPDRNVTAALRALLLHPAFRSRTARTGLVKTPIEYLVGAARLLRLDPAAVAPVLPRAAAALGQQLFDPPNVGGWGQNGYWLDTATAGTRLEVAYRLARQADLSSLQDLSPPDRITALADLLGLDGWGPTSGSALGHVFSDPQALTALGLTAPEFVLA